MRLGRELIVRLMLRYAVFRIIIGSISRWKGLCSVSRISMVSTMYRLRVKAEESIRPILGELYSKWTVDLG